MTQAQIQENLYTIFTIDKEEYGVNVTDVLEILEIIPVTKVPNSPNFLLGIINLRGKVLPIIDLEKMFNLVHDTTDSYKHFLISAVDNYNYGIRVGEVTEVKTIDEEFLKETPSVVKSHIPSEYVKGVAVFPSTASTISERIVLILDLKKLLSKDSLDKIEKGFATI